MKVGIFILLFVSLVYSSEMQRIESIVKDITKLRVEYEECKKNLKEAQTVQAEVVEYKNDEDEIKNYKKLLNEERKKNIILKAQIDNLNVLLLESKNLNQKYKKLSKENSSDTDTQEKKKIVCKKTINKNSFPKLMPKDAVDATTINSFKENIYEFKPSPFRLTKNSKIYNAPNGDVIDTWEERTSFTSDKRTKSWIKITGYFVNKRWVKSSKDMWVKENNAYKRK